MTCTHSNVSYALSMVIHFQSNPGRAHWTTVKNILKYSRRTEDMNLVLGGSDTLRVNGYSNANLQTDRYNFCSQSC